ncbi:MAG: hypothetical protein IRZ03_14755 [Acidobacterium ailaaui]|nr:hypothetical protein [Pseudacidobacterium ailaaui]
MNWFGRRPSEGEDELEAWIQRLHEQRVASGQTQPVGPCPDEEFLRGLAKRSHAISLSDARIDHAATCPSCMSRIAALRNENKERNTKLGYALAAAMCLILVAGIFGWLHLRHNQEQMAVVAQPVSKTVDLWNAGTYRGEQPGQLQSVELPAALVRLTVILPRFSPSGQYLIAVTRKEDGTGVVAEGLAPAVSAGQQQKVSVALDLREVTAGEYFLSTTHEQDQAAYYYPLQIK